MLDDIVDGISRWELCNVPEDPRLKSKGKAATSPFDTYSMLGGMLWGTRRVYAPSGDKRGSLGVGSTDKKLMIRTGSVTCTSEVSAPALTVTRMEYSTSKRRDRGTDRASGWI